MAKPDKGTTHDKVGRTKPRSGLYQEVDPKAKGGRTVVISTEGQLPLTTGATKSYRLVEPRKPKGKPKPHAYGPPVVVEVQVTVKALAFREADGRYSVVVPEIPGCVTEGDDMDDVRAMVADAAGALLAVAHDENRDAAVRDVTGEDGG